MAPELSFIFRRASESSLVAQHGCNGEQNIHLVLTHATATRVPVPGFRTASPYSRTVDRPPSLFLLLVATPLGE